VGEKMDVRGGKSISRFAHLLNYGGARRVAFEKKTRWEVIPQRVRSTYQIAHRLGRALVASACGANPNIAFVHQHSAF
jgi:hypothetical protein